MPAGPGRPGRRHNGQPHHRPAHIDITRRDAGHDEVEFCTILTFDDWAVVHAFAGADHTAAVLPHAAIRLLRSYETESQHYDLAAHREQPGS